MCDGGWDSVGGAGLLVFGDKGRGVSISESLLVCVVWWHFKSIPGVLCERSLWWLVGWWLCTLVCSVGCVQVGHQGGWFWDHAFICQWYGVIYWWIVVF